MIVFSTKREEFLTSRIISDATIKKIIRKFLSKNSYLLGLLI